MYQRGMVIFLSSVDIARNIKLGILNENSAMKKYKINIFIEENLFKIIEIKETAVVQKILATSKKRAKTALSRFKVQIYNTKNVLINEKVYAIIHTIGTNHPYTSSIN